MFNISLKKSCFFIIFFVFSVSSAYSIDLKDYLLSQIPGGYLYRDVSSPQGDVVPDEYELEIFQQITDPSGNELIKDYYREEPPNFPVTVFSEYKELKWEDSGMFIYKMYDYDPEEGTIDETFDPPGLFIPRNMDQGEEVETVLGTVKLVSTSESVDVPAGSFSDCIKLEITGDEEEGVVYLAKGIGEVKSEMSDGEETETTELVIARVGSKVIGDTTSLGCGGDISFAFATPKIKGSSIILDGIYIRGYENTFWAKFDFNLNTLSFVLDPTSFGQDPYDYDNIDAPSISGLNLNEELPFIFPCEKGAVGSAYLYIKAKYNGEVYYLEFLFNPENLSFDILKIWDGSGTPIM